MGLLESAPKDTTAQSLAAQLAGCLKEKKLLQRQPDLSAWGRELNTLTGQVGAARVEAALVWYAANAGQPYIPQAYSARTFRDKFSQIETAMRRDGATPLLESPSDEAVTSAKRLQAKVEWPPEILPHLARIVHNGRLKLAKLRSTLAGYFGSGMLCDRETRFIGHILDARLYSTFVEDDWLAFWHFYVIKKGHWTGPAQALYFDITSQTFHHSFWIDWAMQWAASWEPFEVLYARLVQDSNEGQRQ